MWSGGIRFHELESKSLSDWEWGVAEETGSCGVKSEAQGCAIRAMGKRMGARRESWTPLRRRQRERAATVSSPAMFLVRCPHCRRCAALPAAAMLSRVQQVCAAIVRSQKVLPDFET